MKNEIFCADRRHGEEICRLVRSTILQKYPKFYSPQEVEWFVRWHSIESIFADIDRGFVYYVCCGDAVVGTVTVRGDSLSRLFVLPLYSQQGYGSALLSFAEEKIEKLYARAWIDVSSPAEEFYRKRGYQVERERCEESEGLLLRWKEMTKLLRG